MTWGSTSFGHFFTLAERWQADFEDGRLKLSVADRAPYIVPIENICELRVYPGFFWATCHFEFKVGTGIHKVKVDGTPNDQANAMSRELTQLLDNYHKKVFGKALANWIERFKRGQDWKKWIPKGNAARYVDHFVPPEWPGKTWAQAVGDTSPATTLLRIIKEHNQRHQAEKMSYQKVFFDCIEKNPLTQEQIHACICMDDSVLIVAAAGSGKTSTMVAKTGYVLHEGLATPEQILLLAFNRDAADELGKRAAEQLKDVLRAGKVKSQTFHGFGLEVIGAATGKKPSLAPWVETGKDLEEITRIINALCERNPDFKLDWDMFRTVYARDIGKMGESSEPEILRDGERGYWTANNEVVKSKEEKLIADWLFYHNVNYKYEVPYQHNTASATHQQYRPDFYYPDIQVYHEHFALDANGNPPRHFTGDYLHGVRWKRNVHAEMGTQLFETKSHEIYTGEAIRNLTSMLKKNGVELHFDPSRSAVGMAPPLIQDLARTFRVFQQHVKNNGLSSRALREALAQQSVSGNAPRLAMFLSIYDQIAAEWEDHLRKGGFIDFEDMLVQAADLVERRQYRSPYTFILADEFQDSSRARIRLLKALASNREIPAHLCVVGDDWQGINRFAGSDIAVMTEFDSVFDHATRLTLNTTFRCPQYLCDVSSKFIQKNPVQIRKSVKTTNLLSKTPILAFGFTNTGSIEGFVQDQLGEMADYVRLGKLKPMKGSRVSVMLLGRYHTDRPSMLESWKAKFTNELEVGFKTVHGSKGLEAEYVFVLNVIEGVKGFPSQIQDDPAIQLAMPAPDSFPFAEERRLFYVAMTRARKQVRFYTINQRVSQFLVELVKDGELNIEAVEGEKLEPCSKCGRGVLVLRTGRYGDFYACSRLAQCDFKKNVEGDNKRTVAAPQSRVNARPGEKCPICARGVMTPKRGQYGLFLGCSEYPRCRATSKIN